MYSMESYNDGCSKLLRSLDMSQWLIYILFYSFTRGLVASRKDIMWLIVLVCCVILTPPSSCTLAHTG
ncbi:Para-nitrophenol 4-monooxygenase [Fusarium oxysporum f. sp. albedinis]|nr:Para-nitrophenol 4-monooxygenase [Fusarium oxysporum f. sp. albedinis]